MQIVVFLVLLAIVAEVITEPSYISCDCSGQRNLVHSQPISAKLRRRTHRFTLGSCVCLILPSGSRRDQRAG